MVFFAAGVWQARAQSSEYGKKVFGDFDEELGGLRGERDGLLDELEQLKVQKMQMTEQMKLRIEEAESHAVRLSEQLDRAQGEKDVLKAEKADLTDKLQDALLKLKRFEDVVSGKDMVFMQVKDENSELKKNLQNAEIILQRSAERVQKLMREKESAESELETTKKRLREYFADQESQLDALKKERRDLEKQISRVTANLKAAEDQRVRALQEAQDLRKKLLDQTQKSVDTQVSLRKELNAAIGAGDDARKNAAVQVANVENELKELRKRADDLENKLQVADRMMTLANEKLTYYEESIENLKKNEESVSVPSASGAADASREELATCRSQVEVLKSQLDTLSERHKRVLSQMRETRKQDEKKDGL